MARVGLYPCIYPHLALQARSERSETKPQTLDKGVLSRPSKLINQAVCKWATSDAEQVHPLGLALDASPSRLCIVPPQELLLVRVLVQE